MQVYSISGVLEQTLDLTMFYLKHLILGILFYIIDSTNVTQSSTVGTTLSIGTIQTTDGIPSIIIILLGLGVLFVGYLLDRKFSRDQQYEDPEQD